jgi:GNAT superfamily N-acetyltransferase
MLDTSLLTRLEEAAFNAWPTRHTLLLDGWVLRLGDGYTKRANAVTPLYTPFYPVEPKIAQCEQLYAAHGLLCIFRLTNVPENVALDQPLAERGYTHLHPTNVMCFDLRTAPKTSHTPSVIAATTTDRWLTEYLRLSRASETTRQPHAAILSQIILPKLLGQLVVDGQTVAVGLAVCDDDLVGIFDIVVDPNLRRQGYGRTLMLGLLNWGRSLGASMAYLQVLEENPTAHALYATLGFHDAYRYWYRVAPTSEKR